MELPRVLVPVLCFVLGACVTAAGQSAASAPDTPATPSGDETGATVVALADAPRAESPSKTATITHLARGQNAYVGRLEMQAGGSVPEHRDATEEFIHVLEGSGTITIEGAQHELSAGSTVYMPANALVSFENGDAAMVAIQVFADPSPAGKYDAWSVL